MLLNWLLLVAILVQDTSKNAEPFVTNDVIGVGKFFLLYGTVITGGILAVRKWVNTPVKLKYDELSAHLDELNRQATAEHQEIYREIDRRIGLESGTSVKSMADGIGGRIGSVEVEVGRLEVMVDRADSSMTRNHDEQMKIMMEVSKQVAGLAATVALMVDQRMQRLDRLADKLGD